jgi:hypothetical protein
MIQNKHWSDWLCGLDACDEPIKWAGTMPDPQTAWSKCDDPGWMMWIAGRLCGKRDSARHRQVVLATCACARLVLSRIAIIKERPKKAVELAEAWARRKPGVTLKMVRAAYDVVDKAAYTAPIYSASHVMDTVAYVVLGVVIHANIDHVARCPVLIIDYAARGVANRPGQLNVRFLQIIHRMLPDVPKWFEKYRRC